MSPYSRRRLFNTGLGLMVATVNAARLGLGEYVPGVQKITNAYATRDGSGCWTSASRRRQLDAPGADPCCARSPLAMDSFAPGSIAGKIRRRLA